MGMMEGGNAPEFGPLVLMVIAEVISAVISKCILDRMKLNKPNMIDRWKLNRLVRGAGSKNGLDRVNQDRIYHALLKKGASATVEDVATLLARQGSLSKGTHEELF